MTALGMLLAASVAVAHTGHMARWAQATRVARVAWVTCRIHAARYLAWTVAPCFRKMQALERWLVLECS